MTWHAEPETLARYARGELDDIDAFSVELHVVTCAECRAAIAPTVDEAPLARAWAGVAAEVAMPPPRPIERLLLAADVREHLARLLAATPSLRASWFIAVAVALSFAVVAAHTAVGGVALFLVVAPLLPLAGVAAAYGPGVDPTYEIGLVAPLRSFHLLLIRAVAVLVSTATLALLASLALPRVGWATAAWLLPSLALVAVSLALSSVIAPLAAATGVALVWVATTTLGSALAGAPSFFGPQLQTTVLMAIVVSSWWLSTHRDAFERGERG